MARRMVRWRFRKCCGKLRFATEEAALDQVREFNNLGRNSVRQPRRVYQCEKGWWHMTAWSSAEYDQAQGGKGK